MRCEFVRRNFIGYNGWNGWESTNQLRQHISHWKLSSIFLVLSFEGRFQTAFTLQKHISLVISRFLPNFQAFVSNLSAIPDQERPKYDSRDIHGFKDLRGP